MAKQKAALPEAAPDVLAAVVEPVIDVPQEIRTAKKPVKAAVVLSKPVAAPAPVVKKAAVKKVVKVVAVSEPVAPVEPVPVPEAPKKAVVIAKKKSPAKKTVVKNEVAPEAAAVVEAPKEMPKEEVPVETALPILTAEVEADRAEKKSFVSAPKAEAEAPVFPISRRPAPRPPMRPMMPHVQQTSVKVETKTKTAVAVGLAATGALALAAAAALLSLKDIRPNLMRPFATRPVMSAPITTAPYQPRITGQFIIALSPKIAPVPSPEFVGDGSEHAIAAIDVSAKGAAWNFESLRVQLIGSEYLSKLVVRDESGNPVLGSAVPVPGSDHLFDVRFTQKIPANSVHTYTVFASFSVKGAKVPVALTVMTDGLSARSDAGDSATSLRAPLVGPQWTVTAPVLVIPTPVKAPVKPKK